jgi:hypothetical protein
VYRSRPGLPTATETGVGLLFTQFRGSLEPTFFGKGLPPGARLEQVTLAGRPAFWIEGWPHFFFYRDQAGRQTDERFRLAANVLLWEQGGLTSDRGGVPKEQALRIAVSVQVAWVKKPALGQGPSLRYAQAGSGRFRVVAPVGDRPLGTSRASTV